MDHELAVEALERGDGLAVDRQPPLGVLEVATVAWAAAQCTGTLGVALAVLRETGELGLQFPEKLLAVGLLALGLQGVVAQGIALL